MNTDFVLVRGDNPMWFWFAGDGGWTNNLESAKVIATRDGAERIIGRRQARGLWGNVGYMTKEEAKERLLEK